MNRYHAWRASRARAAAGFVYQPEPRTIGRFAKGRQIIGGQFLFAGHLIEAPGVSIWDIKSPDLAFETELHSFEWLDDLAAVGDSAARGLAQTWTQEWIARFGKGRGIGWTPDLTGRRLIRWINHALFLLNGQGREATEGYYQSLAHQTTYLGRRWHVATPGLPRFEALTGLVYSGLALLGMERSIGEALDALERECAEQVDAGGGLPTRNPEELLEVFQLLNWAATALSEADKRIPPDQIAAMDRIAPTLRALRHADGGLARFHGGGRGLDGRLDTALAQSGIRTPPRDGLAMGFARLSAARTTVIVDAAPPPLGPTSHNAHASTLAFELTSGRRPLIVNCGSGKPFGEAWRSAGRATPSHSTLMIDGYSSSRLGGRRRIAGYDREYLIETPRDVRLKQIGDEGGTGLIAGHDGYVSTHGLTHVRAIDLSSNGRGVAGEDTLAVVNDEDRPLFKRAMDRSKLQGIAFKVRFHLHPEVDAEINMKGAAVSLALKSGEIWVFRHDGVATLTVEPSVYLEKGRVRPRPSQQIVLSHVALEDATRVRWTLAKATDTPAYIRDIERDDDLYS
ncbi:heparinase II/III family protein [Anianabacter salinae]|uniref:heparinase II/III family protein n=1 Tax=Anianabacter salinae TaxID=2851023 RepID=UPI00225E3F4A|nr:heparinase II/III family protein [Anianabacter salinae]MBV0913369.1 heparinase II/III family protein [Anianabacter salinae]